MVLIPAQAEPATTGMGVSDPVPTLLDCPVAQDAWFCIVCLSPISFAACNTSPANAVLVLVGRSSSGCLVSVARFSSQGAITAYDMLWLTPYALRSIKITEDRVKGFSSVIIACHTKACSMYATSNGQWRWGVTKRGLLVPLGLSQTTRPPYLSIPNIVCSSEHHAILCLSAPNAHNHPHSEDLISLRC